MLIVLHRIIHRIADKLVSPDFYKRYVQSELFQTTRFGALLPPFSLSDLSIWVLLAAAFLPDEDLGIAHVVWGAAVSESYTSNRGNERKRRDAIIKYHSMTNEKSDRMAGASNPFPNRLPTTH